MSTELIKKTLDTAERKGFTVSLHPNGTGVVHNFREYLLLFPMKDGSVTYELREPQLEPPIKGVTADETELYKIVKELR